MIKSKPFITILILFLGVLPFTKSFAQRRVLDSIHVEEIYVRKNPFNSRPNIFFIYTRKLPISNLHLRVNYWKTQTSLGLNLNQAAFSDNWSGGGVNSIALGSLFNYKAEYNKDDKNFTSVILLQYGKLKNDGQLERKTNDRIFLDNKAAMALSKNWSFFGSLSFESQFDAGYNYKKDANGDEIRNKISRFMAPGYLTESVGFEYKPVKFYSIRFGTGTARQTFMLDTTLYKNNSKNFGVPIGKTFKNELAFQTVFNFDKDIATNLNLKSRYLLFAAYDRINNIAQRLDATVTAKVNQLVNVTVGATALYDDNYSGRVQYTQNLTLGVLFTIPR
ncbi:MAG: DUF3078 domain-containing protein [Sphingobacteriales bacterium]|nr:DUF3078 domain-containing protein [Sphingobacteriales bacterium]